MKKSDVLVDYAHNIVQMLKKTELGVEGNPPVPEISDYYSIRLSNEKAEILVPFYFNGILSHVYYNDFQKNPTINAKWFLEDLKWQINYLL